MLPARHTHCTRPPPPTTPHPTPTHTRQPNTHPLLLFPDKTTHKHTCTALKSRSALLLPEGTEEAAPPPIPMRYAGPPILTTSMPISPSAFSRWRWSIWPTPALQVEWSVDVTAEQTTAHRRQHSTVQITQVADIFVPLNSAMAALHHHKQSTQPTNNQTKPINQPTTNQPLPTIKRQNQPTNQQASQQTNSQPT